MIILLVFAFVSGLVTIAAPCIWPLLPIVLSSSATGGKRKPFGISLGIIISFAVFTLTISYIVRIFPFDPNVLRLFAVVVISLLGLTLIVPKLTQIFEGWVSRLSSGIGTKVRQKQGEGFKGGLVTGLALGIVWSPCAGPILATIATLAATRFVSFEIILVTLVYVLGVGIPLFLFALAGNLFFTKSRFLSKYTGRIQQIFGVIMILTALAIYTNYDKIIQAKLLDSFPSFSRFINQLESNKDVKNQLNLLKKRGTTPPNLGPAPEFTGISKWLNTDRPLTLTALRGKVVLVDFWTYTCINCIRTLPHVTSWYEKYKDKGFIVIGVHTPEFEFEKKTENVEAAIKQYNIHYPVPQDNDYSTWKAFNNQYWPAEYLIDANGNIRREHFGEGEYDETERAIQALLEEAGTLRLRSGQAKINGIPDQTPTGHITPETYLGATRTERKSDSADGLPPHYFALSGNWSIQSEYAAPAKNSTLSFHFFASKVFLVMNPNKKGDQVKVYLDGKLTQTITLDVDRLYDLVKLNSNEEHTLRLEFLNEGIKVFAFTFG